LIEARDAARGTRGTRPHSLRETIDRVTSDLDAHRPWLSSILACSGISAFGNAHVFLGKPKPLMTRPAREAARSRVFP